MAEKEVEVAEEEEEEEEVVVVVVVKKDAGSRGTLTCTSTRRHRDRPQLANAVNTGRG